MRRFLQDRLISKTGIRRFFYFGPDANLARQVVDVGTKLRSTPPDIAFLGVGENGRLALNNPPADVDSEEPYLTVDLDFNYRAQQVNEGWFVEVGQVPMQAFTASVHQILKSREILAPGFRQPPSIGGKSMRRTWGIAYRPGNYPPHSSQCDDLP